MYRYEVPVDDRAHLLATKGFPLAAAASADASHVEFWAEDDDHRAGVARAYQVFGTGHPLPPGASWQATCPRHPSGLVWHLYQVPAGDGAA
jgi:hypothetical protein